MKLKLYILSIMLLSVATVLAKEISFAEKTEQTEIIENDATNTSEYEKIALDKIHVTTEISESNLYLNQGFTIEHKMYVSHDISIRNWREVDSLKFTDFWSQNISEKQFKIHQGTYKGEPYRYVILKRTVLYPQKTGALTIEPLALQIAAAVPTKERDEFGRFVTENVTVTATSENQTVHIKPLPLEGQPANFSGAVGMFDFTVTTDKNPLQSAEEFQISIAVKGNGNLPLFTLPNPTISNTLKISQPKNADEMSSDLNGVSGLKKNIYTLKVTKLNEKYTIPSISFSYFNPKTERYERTASNEFTIEVTRNEKQETQLKINKKNTSH